VGVGERERVDIEVKRTQSKNIKDLGGGVGGGGGGGGGGGQDI